MIIFIMFLLDTAIFSLDVYDVKQEITMTLTSNSPLSLSDRYALTDSLPWSVSNSLLAYIVRH